MPIVLVVRGAAIFSRGAVETSTEGTGVAATLGSSLFLARTLSGTVVFEVTTGEDRDGVLLDVGGRDDGVSATLRWFTGDTEDVGLTTTVGSERDRLCLTGSPSLSSSSSRSFTDDSGPSVTEWRGVGRSEDGGVGERRGAEVSLVTVIISWVAVETETCGFSKGNWLSGFSFLLSSEAVDILVSKLGILTGREIRRVGMATAESPSLPFSRP